MIMKFIFDSTGVAIEDAVAAAVVYENARASSMGSYFGSPLKIMKDTRENVKSRSRGCLASTVR